MKPDELKMPASGYFTATIARDLATMELTFGDASVANDHVRVAAYNEFADLLDRVATLRQHYENAVMSDEFSVEYMDGLSRAIEIMRGYVPTDIDGSRP